MKTSSLSPKLTGFVLVIALTVALQNCQHPALEDPESQSVSVEYTTVLGESEAQEMTLWLSGELRPREHMWRVLLQRLNAIRAEYGDSIPKLRELHFVPWWVVPSAIMVSVTEELRQKILQGQPNSLDSLNSVYNASHMDTFRLNVRPETVVYFEDHLHPERLSEIYLELADVTYAFPDGWIFDYSNVYPWRSGPAITFLFREAWNCSFQCTSNRFWYFKTYAHNPRPDPRHPQSMVSPSCVIEYLGVWEPGEPEPEWWPEAIAGYQQFHCCDRGYCECPVNE